MLITNLKLTTEIEEIEPEGDWKKYQKTKFCTCTIELIYDPSEADHIIALLGSIKEFLHLEKEDFPKLP